MPSKKKNKSPEEACTSVVPTEEPSQFTQDAADQFERELYWCIDQLQLGLETQNPDSRKAQEAVRVLKILTSSKAPLIKKRQAMRNTFGDYRKKMVEEERKSTAIAKKMTLSKAESGPESSKFFRKSSAVTEPNKTGHAQRNTDITNRFQFNFTISDDMASETNHSDENPVNLKPSVIDEDKHVQTSKYSTGCEQKSSDINSAPFKFERSKNEFRFNFSVKDET